MDWKQRTYNLNEKPNLKGGIYYHQSFVTDEHGNVTLKSIENIRAENPIETKPYKGRKYYRASTGQIINITRRAKDYEQQIKDGTINPDTTIDEWLHRYK